MTGSGTLGNQTQDFRLGFTEVGFARINSWPPSQSSIAARTRAVTSAAMALQTERKYIYISDYGYDMT